MGCNAVVAGARMERDMSQPGFLPRRLDMNSSSQQLHTDIAVVGGGIAGLVAASMAKRAGLEVVVVDPAPLGGRGRTDERAGFLFNRGPHALYLGGPAERALRDLGCALDGAPPSADAFGTLSGTVDVLPGSVRTLATTRLLGVKGKAAIARFRSRLAKASPTTLAETTFAAWLADLNLPADAQALVEMIARVATYTNAPTMASADMVVRQMQMAGTSGVRYLHGGWQTIVDHLASPLGTSGHHAATASSVEREGSHVLVNCADGSCVVARGGVVALADPQLSARLLGRQPFAVGPAVEAVCLDLGTSVRPAHGLLLGVDEPLYLSVHSPSARLAPPGAAVVHVARYLAPGDSPPPDSARAELQAHAALAGVVPDHVLESRYLHRMTVVGAMATAAFGGLGGRPAVRDTGVDGVYLAGDWVGPTGHLLDASVASAVEASAAACRAATLVGR